MTLQKDCPVVFPKFCRPCRLSTKSADPQGIIEDNIEPHRIIGCVVYPAGEIVAPGVVKRLEGDRFPLGELDGTQSERVIRDI